MGALAHHPPDVIPSAPTLAVEACDARLSALPWPWDGQVEAVYHSAAVVVPCAQGGVARRREPRRVTLLAAGRPLLPWSVRLSLAALPVRIGDPVTLRDGCLVLGAAQTGDARARLPLAPVGRCLSAPRWSSPSPAAQDAGLAEARLARLPLPRRTQALLGRLSPEGSPFERHATATAAVRLDALLIALTGAAPPGALAADLISALHGLSGLGPGATPTGDDLLVGVTAAAFHQADRGRLPRAHLAALCQALDALPEQATTPTAREMLREAARGFFPEPLLQLLAALEAPGAPTQDLVSAERELLTIGRQSGADLLAGAVAMTARLTSETPHDA